MILVFGKAYGIPSVAMRYFNVYGPRQSLSNPYNGVVAIFQSRVKNNKLPIINEDGTQTRDFIHVTDVTAANIKAMEEDSANYEVFNVGSGNPISISEVARILIQLNGKKFKSDITGKIRKLDVKHCFADITKIKKLLGWNPTIRFEEGLKEVLKWSEGEKAEDKLDFALSQLEKRGLR